MHRIWSLISKLIALASMNWNGLGSIKKGMNELELINGVWFGQVVCNRCSSNKMTLAYDTCKALRVCDTCHLTLTSRASAPPSTSFDSATGCASPASSPVAEANPSTSSHRTGLLEVALQPPPPSPPSCLLNQLESIWMFFFRPTGEGGNSVGAQRLPAPEDARENVAQALVRATIRFRVVFVPVAPRREPRHDGHARSRIHRFPAERIRGSRFRLFLLFRPSRWCQS